MAMFIRVDIPEDVQSEEPLSGYRDFLGCAVRGKGLRIFPMRSGCAGSIGPMLPTKRSRLELSTRIRSSLPI